MNFPFCWKTFLYTINIFFPTSANANLKNYMLASLFGKRLQRSLFSTLQIGRALINAGKPKEGRFRKTKRLVIIDGDGSL